MIPRATYRVQFGKDFGFEDAAGIAPYLAELGISHVYASPYLLARPGSKHGYDVTNHNALNGELGDEGAFAQMNEAFRKHGLEQILDFVPNHMGVGGADNPLWLDVLEWGRDSRYAGWFDIDWDSHSEYLSGKLLVPFLGEQYGAVLESGKIELRFDENDGAFSVWLYGTHKLPVTPPSYPEIFGSGTEVVKELAGEFAVLRDHLPDVQGRAAELKKNLADRFGKDARVREAVEGAVGRFQGNTGDVKSWDSLDSLIHLQHWRPTHFRVAADDINYRRFFNISELAGIRMELPEVFEHTHRLVLRLAREGSLQGLRIDHIDGLYNPKEYLEKLRGSFGESFYVVVEKILSAHESLREDWAVDGTTGYEFCAQLTALLVDASAEPALTRLYREFTGETQAFSEIVRGCKIKIMENELGSELEALARDAVRVARLDLRTTDFTRSILRRALRQIIACFPVYRTYVDELGPQEEDERYIHWAVAQASKNEEEVDASVFEFLERLLTGRLAEGSSRDFYKRAAIRCAMKAQQLSGPVMAKGLEDTALYRYNRFVGLNEVGTSPGQFGLSVAAFHKENAHRAERWPRTMLATSTHDVKHGEDARARLAALSLVPDEWVAKVGAWSRILRARRGDVEGTAPPARNDEYLFFQNLIATWPAELTLPRGLNEAALGRYAERLQGAMIKSVREARVRSNWISPNTAYENAMTEFVKDALNPEVAQTFLEAFLPFQQQIAEMGVRNSLVQVLLKITSPGVADFYQGSDLWNLSLPDPDNRRTVDFGARRKMLRGLRDSGGKDRRTFLGELLRDWHDGAIKLELIRTLLAYRRENSEVFERGDYEALQTSDEGGARVCAFLRRTEGGRFLAIASLDARVAAGDFPRGRLGLGSQGSVTTRWMDVVAERTIRGDGEGVDLGDVFSVVPVALLVPE
ncbi:MAG: malto-oligosyltrehalose synthase [Candidatus Acidiferrum sp.]